ncbi:MAG: ABC transporter permease [Bacillales bacterium]|jgi:spermidine/putrescine transport system permease protein|nr:ABC transporter permease [Bacillales bacterium]
MVKKIIGKSFIYLMLLLMYAPILFLIVYSFSADRGFAFSKGFSLDLYRMLFLDRSIMSGNEYIKVQQLWTAVTNSFVIAVVSGIVATILGGFGAIGVYFSKKQLKYAVHTVEQVQIATPEIVIALSIVILFVSLGISKGFITLLIGHVLLTLPFVVLSIVPKLKQMDPNLYEAALDLGATPLVALRKVLIPEILPGIFAGFLLSVTLSLDDYIITALTKQDTYETLATYIEKATRLGVPNYVRAFTTLLFIVVLLAVVCINIYSAKQAKKGKKSR